MREVKRSEQSKADSPSHDRKLSNRHYLTDVYVAKAWQGINRICNDKRNVITSLEIKIVYIVLEITDYTATGGDDIMVVIK